MATDNFAAANNPLAAPWTTPANFGAMLSSGGVASAVDDATLAGAIYSTSSETFAEVVRPVSAGDGWKGGPALLDSSGNGYAARMNAPGFAAQIILWTAGAFADIESAGNTGADSDVIAIYIDGDDVVMDLNGVEAVRWTDTTYRTGLKPGIWAEDSSAVLDDWTDGAEEGGETLPMMGQASF
jgi:hypothetical protein